MGEARVEAVAGGTGWSRMASAGRVVLPAFLLFAVAVVQHALSPINADTSWLLTVCERVLDGAVPYVDFVETNPPASILIYLPWAALARALAIRPELAVAAATFGLAALSLFGAARILAVGRGLSPAAQALLPAGAVFVLLILPAKAFAQREHWALLALLPMLALLQVRAERAGIGLGAALAAGVGAGIALAIKPHFAAALLLPALFLLWRTRSIRSLLQPEWAAALAVLALYAASIPLVFPAYLADGLPLAVATYLPLREPFATLVLRYGSLPLALLLAAVLGGQRPMAATPVATLLLAAAGFYLAYLVQGKGFVNHEYPAVALVALAALWLAVPVVPRSAIPSGKEAAGRLLLVRTLLVTGLAIGLQYFNSVSDGGDLAKEVARIAPPHPRMIAVSAQLTAGHPLVRLLDGQWVGRPCSLWVTATAAARLADPGLSEAERQTLRAYAARDRQGFVEDVRRGKPDVVILEGPSAEGWIEANPEVAASLADYALAFADPAREVAFWVRRPAPAATP